jgi:DNA adenine methylase
MKPPIAYYGGKSRLAARIAALFPPHDLYIEPFFGSGAVFFAKRPSRFEVINDIDGQVINFFEQLRDNHHELERLCALSPHSRDEWLNSKTLTGDPLEDARRFWVLINQSFAKTTRNNGWSRTFHRTQSLPASVAGRLGRFSTVAARLMNTTIEHRDAADLIAEIGNNRDTVIYADPPYLATTRRQGKRGTSAGTDYAHEMAHPEDHKRLAEALHASPAAVFLSGYHSPLYDELYTDWHTVEIPVVVSTSNGATTKRRNATEVIWTNLPIKNHQAVLFA